VPAKGVQQAEEQYRFKIPKAIHEPSITFCVWRFSDDSVIWKERLYDTIIVPAYVTNVRTCIRER
jgi:hypothetical protein